MNTETSFVYEGSMPLCVWPLWVMVGAAPGSGVQLFRAPPEVCAVAARAAPVVSNAPDDAPLRVQAGPRGLSVDSRGATVGRVLVAIASAAKLPIAVSGSGARVRIYARVVDQPLELLLDAVTVSSGLVFQKATARNR